MTTDGNFPGTRRTKVGVIRRAQVAPQTDILGSTVNCLLVAGRLTGKHSVKEGRTVTSGRQRHFGQQITVSKDDRK